MTKVKYKVIHHTLDNLVQGLHVDQDRGKNFRMSRVIQVLLELLPTLVSASFYFVGHLLFLG